MSGNKACSFLKVLSPKGRHSKSTGVAYELPPTPWAVGDSKWEIADAVTKHTRTGLSPVGQMIGLRRLCCVEMLASNNPLAKGTISLELVRSVSTVEVERATAVRDRICHDLLFTSAGEELDYARQCVKNYNGSHVESEILQVYAVPEPIFHRGYLLRIRPARPPSRGQTAPPEEDAPLDAKVSYSRTRRGQSPGCVFWIRY